MSVATFGTEHEAGRGGRKVLGGSGFDDPTQWFLRERQRQEVREMSARAAEDRRQLNARCAWEDTSQVKVLSSQQRRADLITEEEHVKHKEERRRRLKQLYKQDWDGWCSQVSKAEAPLTKAKLQERVKELQEAREKERAQAAKEAYARQELAANDEVRIWTAQARMEDMVSRWEIDQQAKQAKAQAEQEAQNAFHRTWESAVPAPVEPSNDERGKQAAALREELSTEWAGSIVDRRLRQRSEQLEQQRFLAQWGAFQSVQEQEDAAGEEVFQAKERMYIWRDEAATDGDEEEAEEEPAFVQAKLTLELDFDKVADDPEAKAAFEAQFVADMAATLGCDPSQLDIGGLEAGSVIVDFKIAAPADGKGADPGALFATLEEKVSSGGLCIAGGAAKGLVDVTPTPPSTDELAAQRMREAARRRYTEYARLNADLAAERAAAQEVRQANEKAETAAQLERDAAAAEEDRRRAEERRQEARRLAEELYAEQLAQAAARKEAVAKESTQDSEDAASQRFWQRAQETLEQQQRARCVLQEEVERGRREQLAIKTASAAAERAAAEREHALHVAETARLDQLEAEAALARRAVEQSARVEIWNQLQADKQRRQAEVAAAADAERARARAVAARTRDAAALAPPTKRIPAQLRGRGIQRPADVVQTTAEQNAVRDEWSREIDRWANSNLELRSASALIYLKEKFLSASSEHSAQLIETQLRNDFEQHEKAEQVVQLMEPAFLDKKRFCLFGQSRSSLGAGLVPSVHPPADGDPGRPSRRPGASSSTASKVDFAWT